MSGKSDARQKKRDAKPATKPPEIVSIPNGPEITDARGNTHALPPILCLACGNPKPAGLPCAVCGN